MPKRILLADDSITIQKVVELTFSDGDYEVTAVNNGAKAIQKLGEMRPDIILSDIIMPEKNGYEVCEYVKSHPDYRNIPVVLLTGTFEPFDPDRADKAGCDAVVTKPFESQSLIAKVNELISAAPPSQFSAAPAPSSSPSPTAGSSTPGSFASPPPPPPPADDLPWKQEPESASEPSSSSFSDSPFGAPPPPETFSGETRAFPKMDFGGTPSQATTQAVPAQPSFSAPPPSFSAPPPPPPSSPTPTPWDEQPPPAGETRALPKMNFEEMQRMAGESGSGSSFSSSPMQEDSPFGAPPAPDQFSGETRAFPKMSFDDLRGQQESTPPPPPPSNREASSPWSDQPSSSFSDDSALPRMSYEDLERQAVTEPVPAQSDAPVWGTSSTTASQDEMPEPEREEDEEDFAASAPLPFSQPSSSSFASEPVAEEAPLTSSSSFSSSAPAWAPAPPAQEELPTPSASARASDNGISLDDEQIDRIARRVVQLMSDQVVRNIAWEVIPDLAEMVVKERIRQLENE